MNDAQEIHRDIYSGMVAEELAKEGYYGEDLTLYGFLESAGGGRGVQIFENEEECAKTYLKRRAMGALVSPIESVHQRCQGSEAEQRAFKEAFCAKLVDAVLQGNGAQVDLDSFWAYEQHLTPERLAQQSHALVGILTLPFAFSKEARSAILDIKRTPLIGLRQYYGFCVKTENGWQRICNGSLPALLNKWQAQIHPVTPIIKMVSDSRAPVYMLRDDFEKTLRSVMDDDYLEMICALYRSVSKGTC